MQKNNSMIKDALILFVITVIAGLCLGLVYQITLIPIRNAEQKAKQEAYKKVFTAAASFEEDSALTQALEDYTAEGAVLEEVMAAKDASGNELGYVMTLIGTEGYGGEIKMSVGVDATGAITGLEVLSMSETAGLGAKCTSEEFRGQFVGINADEITVVKGEAGGGNEIAAISGATVTSNAVTKAVNAGLSFLKAYAGK
jgi:electron transport complex protein RnfG